MNLTNEDKKTLLKFMLAFNRFELYNAAFPDIDTFKIDIDIKSCVLLEKVIMEVLKDEV